MKKLFLSIAVLFLISGSAFAHHNTNDIGTDIPFCGDCTVETLEGWDETFGQEQACKADLSVELGLGETYTGCVDRIDVGQRHTIGTQCETDKIVGEYPNRDFVPGLCVKEGRCVEELLEFIDHPSGAYVVDRTIAVGDPIMIRIFDPGRTVFLHDAFLKKVNSDGTSHYLTNFCNGQCFSPWLEKNDEWYGYLKWDMPGALIPTTDFSDPFFEYRNPSATAQKYWFETKVESLKQQSHFAITEPGIYAFEFVDMRGQRKITDPFTVCADINDCDATTFFPSTCQAAPTYEKPDPEALIGTIEDGHGMAVPDLKIVLIQDETEVTETFTDEDGNYEFAAEDWDPLKKLRFKFIFDAPDNANGFRFSLYDERVESADPAFATTLELWGFSFQDRTFELDSILSFEGIGQQNSGFHNLKLISDLEDFGRTHALISKAYGFMEDTLGVAMNFQKPVKIGLFHDDGVYYIHTEHKIYIQGDFILDDSNWDDRESPDNSQWHELSHALMFASEIGGARSLPESHNGVLEWNHLGYANASTTDSLMEGFASWMSAVISQELDYNEDPTDEPWLYRVGDTTTINLEDDLKAWDSLGRRESLAVAALLWDLYDASHFYGGSVDDDDHLNMDINEIWGYINDPEVRDMKDVYDAIQSKWGPDTIGSSKLDEIYIAHGFFVDENGDGVHQDGEEVGRAAYGVGFRTSFDLDRDGIKFYWNPSYLTPGPWITLDSNNQAHWGSHNENDFNDNAVYDVDGDGLAELTEAPFYVFPFLERRNLEEYPEESLKLNITDKDGNILEEAKVLVQIEYDNPNEWKNFSYVVKVAGDGQLGFWVPSGAKAVITAGAADLISSSMTITGDQYRENLTYDGDQGTANFKIPGTKSQIADKMQQSFGDVPITHPNYDAIEYVKSKNIVVGYEDGTYKPDQAINRAEFTKIIMETVFGDNQGAGCFTDVANEWFAKYICSAKDRGVINGYPSGNFEPAWEIAFVEAAKIIVEAYGFDTVADAEWYKPYVDIMTAKKAIPLTINSLEKKITRGEMAEMIYRVHAKIEEKEAQVNLL